MMDAMSDDNPEGHFPERTYLGRNYHNVGQDAYFRGRLRISEPYCMYIRYNYNVKKANLNNFINFIKILNANIKRKSYNLLTNSQLKSNLI